MPIQFRNFVPEQHLHGINGVAEEETVHWEASIRQKISAYGGNQVVVSMYRLPYHSIIIKLNTHR